MNAKVDIQGGSNSNVGSKQEVDPESNEKGGVVSYIQSANHPWVCVVTISFKIASITSFICLSLFVESAALVYLTVILLASFDFWITKNVSGRKLVGLRWWNEVKEDGTEVWIFESKNEKKEASADTRIFWGSVYISAAVWTLIFIWDIISFKWIWAIIAFVCFLFAATNLYGFFKCSKKQQENVGKLGTKAAMKAMQKGAEVAQNN